MAIEGAIMNENSKQFVLRYKPAAICAKVYEEDQKRFDWCIIEKGNSAVLGTGNSQESAWNAASIWLKIKQQKK